VGVPVRLLVAQPSGTAAGNFVATQHVGPSWFVLRQGGVLPLGLIHAAGNPRVIVEGTPPPTDPPVHMCPGSTTTAGEADLPYDVRPQLGDTFKLDDAFLARGPLPAAIVSVTMDGGDWRLTELQADTAFTITQADCDHVGNRDVGRDRIFVTWKNADGSTRTDHLDLRYCDGGGGGGSSSASTTSSTTAASCEDDSTNVCGETEEVESECEHGSAGMEVDSDDASGTTATCSTDGTTKPANPSTAGDPTGTAPPMGGCVVNLDCGAGFQCVRNRCEAIIL